MIDQLWNSAPLKGKTYSLYGNNSSTDEYYKNISQLSDEFVRRFGSEKILFDSIKKLLNKKQLGRKYFQNGSSFELIRNMTGQASSLLSVYTTEVNNHLKTLLYSKKIKKIFTLSEQQYHFYMIFIELVNRINIKSFKSCEYKIAFLPHCIKDRSGTCKSVKDHIDFKCKACSKICRINFISETLRWNDIDPYIWMTADLKRLFKILNSSHSTIGVLGIACIPELVKGMQFCEKYDLPVVGIPLDANRCARWMGKFYDNTVNIKALNRLLN
jgi:hypothetical protein